MGKIEAMQFRFKHLLLFLFFFVVFLECITADGQNGISQTIKAPHKNVGNNVIDGTGTEVISFEDGDNATSDLKGRVSVSTVALFTLAMAAATGLGAVPFFFVEIDPQWAGICNGMAAGVMLAASFDLIQEGQEHGAGTWVVIGILAGGIFILLCKKVITVSHIGYWV